VDFGAGYGEPIRAAADGTVVEAGWLGGYGNATVIDHGKGMATLYGHQSKILVSQGQSVKRGQVIGLVGATGFATGPHLHFEVRIDGTPVDPLPYL
jgi:murein DD-endopeptidase MepM/ murein hydrolase activator NlpD